MMLFASPRCPIWYPWKSGVILHCQRPHGRSLVLSFKQRVFGFDIEVIAEYLLKIANHFCRQVKSGGLDAECVIDVNGDSGV